MSRASNSLKTSDVITTPIKLKYATSFSSASAEEAGIEFLTGTNNAISINGTTDQETLLYRSVRHLYYSNYLTGSTQTSASYADNWLQSTAALNTVEADRRSFPTGSGDTVKVISIPREVFGEKIARRSFRLLSDTYDIVDDGNGNLWDMVTLPGYLFALYFATPDLYFTLYQERGAHVGNILYAQGMIIITNVEYQNILGP